MKQGCPLELTYVSSGDGEYGRSNEKRRMEWAQTWGGGIYTLAYTDDVILIAEEDGMRSMIEIIERLEGYLEKKGLKLNVGKLKILRFRKGGGREKSVDWRWRGKMIEEVKEFSYLGYTEKGYAE